MLRIDSCWDFRDASAAFTLLLALKASSRSSILCALWDQTDPQNPTDPLRHFYLHPFHFLLLVLSQTQGFQTTTEHPNIQSNAWKFVPQLIFAHRQDFQLRLEPLTFLLGEHVLLPIWLAGRVEAGWQAGQAGLHFLQLVARQHLSTGFQLLKPA